MARSDDDILGLLAQRKTAYADPHSRMAEITKIVEGRKQVPLPELNRGEKPAVPNLIGQALDQMSRRISSTMPTPKFWPTNPTKPASVKNAATRRAVVRSWWDANALQLHMAKRARHLLAYGFSPVILRFDRKLGMPRWQVRDPRDAYPGIATGPNPMAPDDFIFSFQKPWYWLLQNYPDQIQYLRVGDKPKPNDLFELVEYADAYCHKLIVVGKNTDPYARHDPMTYGSGHHVTLESSDHNYGMCPVVVANRIVLDETMGAYDLLTGVYERYARLQALREIAIERGIFAEPWLEPLDGNVTPQVVVRADGMDGTVGITKGGRITWDRPPSDFAVNNLAAEHERTMRVDGAIPAEWGAESNSTNVRTAARAGQVISAATDPTIAEAHLIFQASLYQENLVAIAVDKANAADDTRRPVPYAVKVPGTAATSYNPRKLWAIDRHEVAYPIVGADYQTLNIIAAQKVGTGLWSPETGLEFDPMIEDADREKRRIWAHRLNEAVMVQIENDPNVPIEEKARMAELLASGQASTPAEAAKIAQREAQERQATVVEPGAPEAMPGMNAPGIGGEAGTLIPEPTPSVENLANVFSMTRRPNMTIPAERTA